jgi:HK97 family phage major capsid protein
MERRDVLTSSTGAPVPTSFYDQVIMLARAVGPMLNVATTLNTAGGENLQIPRLSTYSVGTVNAEAATLGESDPAFSAFITLGAFKYGFLTQISRELLEDSGVDILALLAQNCGNALGFAVNTALTSGTDTTEPNGVVTASGSALIGGTGLVTTGAFTYENLVSLYYSLDPAARALPGIGFMAKGSSIAAMRTLKDGAGNFVFQPSMSESTPDRVLGVPLYENPAMAAIGASTKSVIAGHFPSYYVRTVGGIRLDRSDDFAFSADLVTFRCTFRVDGDLPQTSTSSTLWALQPDSPFRPRRSALSRRYWAGRRAPAIERASCGWLRRGNERHRGRRAGRSCGTRIVRGRGPVTVGKPLR